MPPQPDSRAALALGLVAAALFVQAYDIAAIGVALGNIGTSFAVGIGTTQWVVNALSLGYGVTIVIGGRMADVFGPNRVLAIGMVVIAIGALVGAAAPGVAWLIGGRAVEGVGAGLSWPAGLSFAYSCTTEDRAASITGIFVAAIAVGNAVGPIIGGLLVDTLGWRSLLLVEVPVALTVVVPIVTRFGMPSRARRTPPRIDYGGATLLGAALVALLIGLDRAGSGESIGFVLCGVAGLALLGFVVQERRAGNAAIVTRDVISRGDFMFACLAILTVAPAFWVGLVYIPVLAERGLKFSAGLTGVAMLPMMATFTMTSLAAGRWHARHGSRRLMAFGAGSICIGALTLTLLPDAPRYPQVAVGIILLGLGIGTFFPAVTTRAAMSVSGARRGVATGLLYTAEIIGGAIGLAIATVIFTNSPTSPAAAAPVGIHGIQGVFLLVAVAAAASALISFKSLGATPEHELAT
jgi:MFS family permease